MLVYRYSLDHVREWLKVTTKTNTEVTKAQKWEKHGDIVDTGMAGNGYHGRCANCGYALVTDLGYTSWVDYPKCEIERKEVVTVIHNLTWRKTKAEGTELCEEDADKHFRSVRDKQGWGKYNFQIEC